ncbi:MAG: GNAT family N-acetyltransferase [Oscillospiraceae bacterium]|nr:GNAT family N-acetyltransferase [Oscillospiraceae bacterium]
MQFKLASELPFDPRPQIAAIFAEGFYEDGLKYFAKDKAKLARAIAHMFLLDKFHVAVEGEDILAIVACVDRRPPPIKLDKRILVKELGFVRGRLAHWGLHKFIINKPLPYEKSPQTGSIEFVATAPEHRGKGAASGLLSFVMDTLPFDNYALEVISHNAAATKLYEKLGFREFMRTPGPGGASGIEYFVYMRRD